MLPLAAGCPVVEPYVDDVETDEQYESLRRHFEGGVVGAAGRARVEAAIRSVEMDLGGTAAVSLRDRMAAHRVPGVTIAVIDGGVVQWVEAWGAYEVGSGAPMLRLSPLQAASISKPTTALTLLHLVDEGEIELDAPLNASLETWTIPSSPHTATQPVTLRRVLSHTAGFDNAGFFGYAAGSAVPTLEQVLDGVPPANHPAIRLQSVPGSTWQYSGGGYTVLARVVEDITRQPFGAWVHEKILRRAAMWSSHFDQPTEDPRVLGRTIGSVFGSPVAPHTYPELPAAGLWTNTLDLGRLVVAIQRSLAGEPGAVLSREVALEMITPQSPGPGFLDIGGPSFDPRMGLGLFLAGGDDPGWFWHTGSNVGFNCLIVGDTRGGGHGVAIMTNAWPGGIPLAWEITAGIAAHYQWPPWDD